MKFPLIIDEVENPVVTICLATYQSEPYLQRTLQAIRNQTYPHFRCIISDDASKDKTTEICQKLCGEDGRFEFQANSEQLGWIGNMNRILAQDLGAYFVTISHDDEIKPAFLETLLSHLAKNPDASVVYSDAEEFLGEQRERNILSYDKSHGNISLKERARPIAISRPKDHWFLAYHGLVRNSSLKFSRKLRRNLAGEFTADKLWVLGLAVSGKFVRIPEILWRKESSEDSVSAKWNYSLFAIAAVQLAAGIQVLESRMKITDRLAVWFYLLLGWGRVARWKFLSFFA